jgi:hypothetical protein
MLKYTTWLSATGSQKKIINHVQVCFSVLGFLMEVVAINHFNAQFFLGLSKPIAHTPVSSENIGIANNGSQLDVKPKPFG